MSAGNSSQRERNKEKLKKNVLDGRERHSVIPAVMRYYRKYIAAGLLMLAAFAALIILCMFIYSHFRTYSTYRVNWQVQTGSSAEWGYIKMGNGAAVVRKDGISFYGSKGEERWMLPYEMKNPVTVQRGDYLLVYDLQGQSMIVCTCDEQTGMISTSEPISKADISLGGVVAAVLESARSSRICYYQKDGTPLDIEVQSPLATNGYPLAVSISPQGQQLAVSYYCIENGAGACRVDFYDFEEGKDKLDRIVSSFSYAETDTYIPIIHYGSDSRAFAVGDNRILFYSAASGGEVTQTEVVIENEIQRVFYNESRLGIVMLSEDGAKIQVYDMAGKRLADIPQDGVYDNYCFANGEILMYSARSCKLVTMRGRVRFDAEFQNEICGMVPTGKKKSFYLGTMDVLQKITLK